MSVRDTALRYIRRGWHIIPTHSVQDNGLCECGATSDYSSEPKHAIGKHPHLGVLGHRESSNNEMQVNTWLIQWPNCNISIATGKKSGLIVLDIDKKNGGLDSLHKLWDQHSEFPACPVVHSGGGGFHFYFKHPGFEVRGRRGMMPGVDVMADGGRIVAPPSRHKSGKSYSWDKFLGEEVPLPEVPKWLLEMVLQKQSKRRLLQVEGPDEEPIHVPMKVFRNQWFR